MKRPKHKAPVLFGVPLRRSWFDKGQSAGWSGRYGWLAVYVTEQFFTLVAPHEVTYRITARLPGSTIFEEEPVLFEGETRTVDEAARCIESVIRRIGRALPAAALVSRKEWRVTND